MQSTVPSRHEARVMRGVRLDLSKHAESAWFLEGMDMECGRRNPSIAMATQKKVYKEIEANYEFAVLCLFM